MEFAMIELLGWCAFFCLILSTFLCGRYITNGWLFGCLGCMLFMSQVVLLNPIPWSIFFTNLCLFTFDLFNYFKWKKNGAPK